MEEEQRHVPEIFYSEIDGNEFQEIYKSLNKSKNISLGLLNSMNEIGRPKKVSNETAKRAYLLCKTKRITQKEIAESWGVSERTVRRRFKELR